MNNRFSSRTRLMFRIGGMLLLSLMLLLSTVIPSMAKDKGTKVKISYFYSFINKKPHVANLYSGETFTIYDDFGGCGTDHHDIALVEVNDDGQIRAYNHDCLSGDGPGTYGEWVSSGCSAAEEFGFVVEACVLKVKDKNK